MNGLMDKRNHINVLLAKEKAYDKLQFHFLIKVLKKLGIKGIYTNTIKVT